jgi:hypothetical protein
VLQHSDLRRDAATLIAGNPTAWRRAREIFESSEQFRVQDDAATQHRQIDLKLIAKLASIEPKVGVARFLLGGRQRERILTGPDWPAEIARVPRQNGPRERSWCI